MTTRQVAESQMLQVIARFSMIFTPILLAASVWFGSNWLDGRFVAVATEQTSLREDVTKSKEDAADLKERMRVVETNQARGREDREQFQQTVTDQLQTIISQLGVLSAGFASLTATVEAQQRQIDRTAQPP